MAYYSKMTPKIASLSSCSVWDVSPDLANLSTQSPGFFLFFLFQTTFWFDCHHDVTDHCWLSQVFYVELKLQWRVWALLIHNRNINLKILYVPIVLKIDSNKRFSRLVQGSIFSWGGGSFFSWEGRNNYYSNTHVFGTVFWSSPPPLICEILQHKDQRNWHLYAVGWTMCEKFSHLIRGKYSLRVRLKKIKGVNFANVKGDHDTLILILVW